MTTRSEMHVLRGASQQVVAALRDIHAMHVADRLERCAVARRHRVSGHWHWTCRSAGCPWCSRPLIARWQAALFDVIGTGTDVSTVVVHLGSDDRDLRTTVRTFRRSLRDIRDRAGRRRRVWRKLSAGGILVSEAAGRRVVLRVRHHGLTRSEVAEMFRRRWSSTTISASPTVPDVATVGMPLADRISLALLRRGVEPLRIALAPQGVRSSRLQSSNYVEPMPVLV